MIDVLKLHHVSFTVGDLNDSKRFFGEILQLPEIERPDFQFSGTWYAIGDRQLHLIAQTSTDKTNTQKLGQSDHIALEVLDVEAAKRVFDESGIDYELGGNSSLGMEQVFCQDPDGHVIELVYYHKANKGGSKHSKENF